MKKNSLFIVLEGIDGSGKTTLAQTLSDTLNSLQISTKYFYEPTHSKYGLEIRKFLKKEINLSKQEIIELFLLDREFSVKEHILPNLEKGNHVVLDRYFYSMAAYQGDEIYTPSKILEMNLQKKFPSPNVLFFLNIPISVALQRIQLRGGKQETFDSISELERITKNYLDILPPNAIYLNAQKKQKELLEECLKHLGKS